MISEYKQKQLEELKAKEVIVNKAIDLLSKSETYIRTKPRFNKSRTQFDNVIIEKWSGQGIGIVHNGETIYSGWASDLLEKPRDETQALANRLNRAYWDAVHRIDNRNKNNSTMDFLNQN